jgi:UDP-N-acetylmuramoylalanine--D-glutamate ligase
MRNMKTQKTLIIGLGKTGLSCARYLHKQHIPFAIMDTRDSPPGLVELKAEFPEVPVYLGGLNEEVILQAKELIVSPGLSLHEPAIAKAIANNIPVIGDIELFARAITVPLIAITGTNGKGTVTTLMGDMTRCAGKNVCVGGNIGTPVLDLLSDQQPDLYVLEISSFQLETTHSLKPAVATILNITADHLDRYDGKMESYIVAKQHIYENAEVVVWNRDDKNTFPQESCPLSRSRERVPDRAGEGGAISFGLSEPIENQFGIRKINQENYLAFGATNLLSVNELKIKGQHNWVNALAALALGHALQLPMSAMLQALREFKGLKHRCEWVIEKNGVQWFDDSKGTNVGSTTAAIEGIGSTIAGKIILIAGGLGKGANFSPLREPVQQYVKTLILIGKDALILADVLQGATNIQHANSLQQAMAIAKEVSQSGDAVLLSPACASMDMFRDAEERGDKFKALALAC